jgi:SPP1 family predicted phage head-tail adaptor
MSCGRGPRDNRITLQQRAPGANVLGERTGAWADVITVWASARPVRTRDRVALAGAAITEMDVVFELDWRAIDSAWRVVWRNEPYEIVGEPVDVRGAKRVLELNCTKGVRSGR